MAYINKEKVAEIRAKLKAEFPDIKFSVRKDASCHKLYVAIMKAPYQFLTDAVRAKMQDPKDYWTINQYWYDTHGAEYYHHLDKIKRIIEICNEGNWNNSNAQIDYFDVGWYFDISVGQWGKPFQYTGK